MSPASIPRVYQKISFGSKRRDLACPGIVQLCGREALPVYQSRLDLFSKKHVFALARCLYLLLVARSTSQGRRSAREVREAHELIYY